MFVPEMVEVHHRQPARVESVGVNDVYLPPAPETLWALRKVQTKLTVGRPDDPMEHEADSIADQVMKLADPHVDVSSIGGRSSLESAVRRKCACEASREPCKGCAQDGENKTRQNTADSSGRAEPSADLIEGLRGKGSPLDEGTRTFMETRFGRDFSQVRIHTGPQAEKSAHELNAHAYTVGRDIVMRRSDIRFRDPDARRLLAHELVHVVQQNTAPRLPVVSGIGKAGLRSHPMGQIGLKAIQTASSDLGIQRQPASPPKAPSPDWRTSTYAFNLILQQQFPVISKSWYSGTRSNLPAGVGVRADIQNGRDGRVMFEVSPDFAPAGVSAGDTATDPEHVEMVRKELSRVLDWRLQNGILTGDDITVPWVSGRLRAMPPLGLRALRTKPKVDTAAGAEIDRILAITTQLPTAAQFSPNGAAVLTVGGLSVHISPDTRSGTTNETGFTSVPNSFSTPGFTMAHGRVTGITGSVPAPPRIEITTNYAASGPRSTPDPVTATSAYGRGTTPADRSAGSNSLRFHESRHGEDVLKYIAAQPFPVYTGQVGMTVAAFGRAGTVYLAAVNSWFDGMGRATLCATDCVGTPDIDAHEGNRGASLKCRTCRP